MRAIVLTSTFRRHVFVANTVAAGCDLMGVWQEEKTFRPERYAHDAADEKAIQRHFAERDASEARYFSADSALQLDQGAVQRTVAAGACNEPAEVTLMEAARPDVVLVFGTGILREPLLSAFEGRILNIHLGLSPYYRGAGTNFWPLVNRQPEYVGATIHYLDAGIDTGPILSHARPLIEHGDGPHDLGNKTIVAAAAGLLRAAAAHVSGSARAVPQWSGGRLYQRKDFSADAVRAMYRNFDTSMIAEYLSARDSRDAALRLIAPGSVA
ncbi:MAG: formyl transferase [Acidobacteria bacterium]|nr:formyl transferase [Acidobacteriota bacterium]